MSTESGKRGRQLATSAMSYRKLIMWSWQNSCWPFIHRICMYVLRWAMSMSPMSVKPLRQGGTYCTVKDNGWENHGIRVEQEHSYQDTHCSPLATCALAPLGDLVRATPRTLSINDRQIETIFDETVTRVKRYVVNFSVEPVEVSIHTERKSTIQQVDVRILRAIRNGICSWSNLCRVKERCFFKFVTVCRHTGLAQETHRTIREPTVFNRNAMFTKGAESLSLFFTTKHKKVKREERSTWKTVNTYREVWPEFFDVDASQSLHDIAHVLYSCCCSQLPSLQKCFVF